MSWNTRKGSGPKKYGLQIRKKTKGKKIAKHSIFDNASDPEDDISKINSKTRKEFQKIRERKAEKKYKKILDEDPNAFAYDEVYDDMQRTKLSGLKMLQKDKIKRKSRYLKTLKANAAVRQKYNAAAKEKMLKRQRMKTDEIYKDTKKFVTRAYKDKLQEDERVMKLIELKDVIDQKNKGNTLGFSTHLYHQLTGKPKREESSSSESDTSSSSSSESDSDEKRKRKKRKRKRKEKKRKRKKIEKKKRKAEKTEQIEAKEASKDSVADAKARYLARFKKNP